MVSPSYVVGIIGWWSHIVGFNYRPVGHHLPVEQNSGIFVFEIFLYLSEMYDLVINFSNTGMTR